VFDNASGQAHGQMTSTNPAASGQWYLVREPTESLNGQSADATLDALMALQRAQDSLAAVEEEREALEGALEEVSAAAVDNPDFRSVAEQRLGVTQKNADELERKIQERQSSVDQLAEKLASSARVNAMGQLVSLGRESLRQDAQWIQSVLLRFAPETSGDFEKNLQRARSVDQMKRQIEDERRRLAELRSRANEIQRGDPDAAPEVESDE
jgi:phosphoglycerate-specific signal transduction histidine kinase